MNFGRQVPWGSFGVMTALGGAVPVPGDAWLTDGGDAWLTDSGDEWGFV